MVLINKKHVPKINVYCWWSHSCTYMFYELADLIYFTAIFCLRKMQSIMYRSTSFFIFVSVSGRFSRHTYMYVHSRLSSGIFFRHACAHLAVLYFPDMHDSGMFPTYSYNHYMSVACLPETWTYMTVAYFQDLHTWEWHISQTYMDLYMLDSGTFPWYI